MDKKTNNHQNLASKHNSTDEKIEFTMLETRWIFHNLYDAICSQTDKENFKATIDNTTLLIPELSTKSADD